MPLFFQAQRTYVLSRCHTIRFFITSLIFAEFGLDMWCLESYRGCWVSGRAAGFRSEMHLSTPCLLAFLSNEGKASLGSPSGQGETMNRNKLVRDVHRSYALSIGTKYPAVARCKTHKQKRCVGKGRWAL